MDLAHYSRRLRVLLTASSLRYVGFMKHSLLALLTTFMLTACTTGPSQLGISQQAWQRLSPLQQQQYITRYHEQHKLFMQQSTSEPGLPLQVSMLAGKAMMPPFIQAVAFKPTEVMLAAGECKKVWLYAKPEKSGQPGQSGQRSSSKVRLAMCYQQHLLAIDPSYYQEDKQQGTLFIHYHPMWRDGLTYNRLHSEGYVRLQQTSIRVQLMQPGDYSAWPTGELFALAPR